MRHGKAPARAGRSVDSDVARLLIVATQAGSTSDHRWQAALTLRFRIDPNATRTLLVERSHSGPLLVQKPLYPEGERCHVVIVHPPGGIAGGDQVHISVALESASKALITTPGATRWYKTNGRPATQGIELRIADDAQLEWLPQETILFDAADATSEVTVELAPRSVYIGCDVLCLGRAAAGERLTRGRYRQRMSLRREGRPIWMERGMFEPARSARHAAVAFADATVAGTVIAAAPEITPGTLESVRSVLATQWGSKAAASRLPGGLLVARYLGDSSEQARRFVLATWSILRPALMECPAIVPRLWNV